MIENNSEASKEIRRRFLEDALGGVPPKVLVIDDDPTFKMRIISIAERQNISITVCTTLEELKKVDPKEYSVALVDYYLDGIKGPQVASLMGCLPVVMMSYQSDKCLEDPEPWPDTVRLFINKRGGLLNILMRALEVSIQRPADA